MIRVIHTDKRILHVEGGAGTIRTLCDVTECATLAEYDALCATRESTPEQREEAAEVLSADISTSQ